MKPYEHKSSNSEYFSNILQTYAFWMVKMTLNTPFSCPHSGYIGSTHRAGFNHNVLYQTLT